MFAVSNIVFGIAKVLDSALSLYKWILLIRVLLSWVNPDPYNPIVIFLRQVTDPLLRWIRKILPPLGMIDLSPIVAFFIISFLQIALINTLYQIAINLR
jgi:YggT family protein